MDIHATKLHRPLPRTDWVARERLITQLDSGLQQGHRLILVSAPAGSGKTTLLGGWLADRSVPSAWLSLEPDDDEPTRFWMCVLHALQSVLPELGGWALEALNSPAPPPMPSLLPRLLNEIGSLHRPLILVLDDYHVLTARGIHENVATMVDHLPEQVRLVICTRADPPLPLARWRARGELTEVRAASLRFSAAEAHAFLNRRMALNLPLEDAALLVERTEGWAAGLQMAGLSLQGRSDLHAAIQSFAGSRQYVMEYLLDEVLARQPEETQRFLLRTAVLDRMCGPLCDAVVGEDGLRGAERLLELQRQNLFVIPLDDERCWYRYHHLFADLLRARLRQAAPELEPVLHRKASIWYEANGAAVEAVRHALAAQDWERAARLLEAHEQDWWTGSDAAVMNLLPHLPDEVVLRGPNLSVYKAWFLLIRGQLQSAAGLLATVERTYGGDAASEENRGLLNFVAMQQAYIAEFGGAPGPRKVDVGGLTQIPESRGGLRNSAEVVLAYVLYREGDFAEAARLLQATIARDLRTGATNGIPISASRLARMWIVEGRLQEAADLCLKYLPWVEARGKWRFYVAGNLSIVLGDVLREWGRLDEAEACVRAGIADNEPWGIAHAYALGYCALARVLLAKGDVAGAAAALAQQESLTAGRTIPPDLASERRAAQVNIWLANGETACVAGWAAEWSHLADEPADFRREQEMLTLARAWIALGRIGAATDLLRRVRRGAAQGGRAGRVAETDALLVQTGTPRGVPPAVTPSLVEALTPREQEVLNLLASGCSNQDIAGRLVITLHAVKKHTGNIYGKLGVMSRTQAIVRARELGLLS